MTYGSMPGSPSSTPTAIRRASTRTSTLLYSFSVPVLYGRGQRSYVLAQYEPTDALTLEAKYGVTWYANQGLRARSSIAAASRPKA